ncbi:MAG: 30S ribosomal protein S6 [Defluviitaleaceae bacterium]|nr:30S ribosomal protein S6 [Defluviitaleaceae bacterium]
MEPNKYELGIILRADLEEEVFRADMDRVKGLIERFGGTIDKIDDWGRRKLAYPINKLTEGVYHFITFTSEGGTPREVESRLRFMENVLRFLVIRKDDSVPDFVPEQRPEVKAEVAVEPVVEVAEAAVETVAEAAPEAEVAEIAAAPEAEATEE